MRLTTLVLTLTSFTATASAEQRPDSATFIVRLGRDTISIERYIRTANELVVVAVQRSPSTMVHRLVLDVDAQDNVKRAVYEVTAPGIVQPVLQRLVTFEGDSAVVITEQRGQSRTERVAARGVIPIAGPFFTPYELAVRRAIAGRAAKSNVQLLANTSVVDIPIERVSPDSVSLTNQFGEPMRAHVDARGRFLRLHTPAFTTLERTRWVDLDKLAKDFAARDAIGKGLGALSPRQTYRARVGEANVWVDYSRPVMRGRPVWGGLIPYNRVWRMGANDAAHLATDRTLEIGGVTLTPGTYTLFLLPAENDLTLIINRRTGMSGLDYDAAQDVGRVKLEKQTATTPMESFTISIAENEAADGGTLTVGWDRMRGSIPFRVR
jgi:hypothetical protein